MPYYVRTYVRTYVPADIDYVYATYEAFVKAWVGAFAAAGPAMQVAAAASASDVEQILYNSLAAAARVVLELRSELETPTLYEVHTFKTSPRHDFMATVLLMRAACRNTCAYLRIRTYVRTCAHVGAILGLSGIFANCWAYVRTCVHVL